MALTKPASVENDAFKSAKWDEITAGREFQKSDAPTLALLTQWYKIVQQAQDEIQEPLMSDTFSMEHNLCQTCCELVKHGLVSVIVFIKAHHV